jgi:YesN/AraC family two-component response regulator
MIRAILVDDKKNHLNLIRKALALYSSDLEIIGAYTNPAEAIAQIIHLKPDVLFLDIEMPGISGFKLAASVSDICNNVIYFTNYMKYGPDSYKHKAIYFIDKDRMEEFMPEAMAKLKARLTQQHFTGAEKFLQDTDYSKASRFTIKRLAILGDMKICLSLAKDNLKLKKVILLSIESYDTLSKFIFYKLFALKMNEAGRDIINQKQDREIFINLSQSKSHFIKNVNARLVADNIQLLAEDFFTRVRVGDYTFALNADEIDLPDQQKLLENWIKGFIRPVIEKKKFEVICLADKGILKIERKPS